MNKNDLINNFLFEIEGQFHQPNAELLSRFYDYMKLNKKIKINWFKVVASLTYTTGLMLTIVGMINSIENFALGIVLLIIGALLIIKS